MRTRAIDWFMAGALLVSPAAALAADAARATDGFRQEHAEVKEHLSHIDAMAGSLAKSDSAEQKKTAAFVVKFLTDHIIPHAEWEEAHLYPAVDRRTHAGPHPFTGSMRYEHTIIGRSIRELGGLAGAAELDAAQFTRRTDRLLGLIAAHFEEEEEVLLPILDASSTREQLEKELGTDDAHEKH